MTACLSTIESCNADLTPVIFKSRGRSLCKWNHREMEGFFDKMARRFPKQLHSISLLLHAHANQIALKQSSSLVHGVWNNTFSFRWSLVIPYCPVGHTHFRYHIRYFPFHAGRCKLQQMHRPCGKFRHWETFFRTWLVCRLLNIPIHTWIESMIYDVVNEQKTRYTWLKLVENQQMIEI